MNDFEWKRLGLICSLVEKSEKSKSELGRTALMKFAYLLKEVKGVPLDYRFTLNVYGPFHSKLLDDLRYAETLEAIKSSLVSFPGGYGYVYSPGPKIKELKDLAGDFLKEYDEEISWVVDEFGNRTAGDLETISTLVYVDSNARKRESENFLDELADKVFKIKPHLVLEDIRREAGRLYENGHLKAVKEQQ